MGMALASTGPFANDLHLAPHRTTWTPHHTHTHTHPFNGPLSGTTRVSRYQKGKTNLDFTKARDSEWQLGHMQICTSLQTDNHTSTPPLSKVEVKLKRRHWSVVSVCRCWNQCRGLVHTQKTHAMMTCLMTLKIPVTAMMLMSIQLVFTRLRSQSWRKSTGWAKKVGEQTHDETSVKLIKKFKNRWIYGKVTNKNMVISCTLCTWPTHC